MSDNEDGWCGGHTVFMDDGAPSAVLGPDGEPVKYVKRHVAGFDLRKRATDALRTPHKGKSSER